MASETKKTQRGAKPIYIICGKDKFLLSRGIETLLDELLPHEVRSMALYQPAADNAVVADVLDELRTLPFLAERRVVLIKDADDFVSANRQTLEKYFDHPSPTGVLILGVESWPKTTRLAKKLAGVGQFIEIGQIKPWELPRYISSYTKQKHGRNLNSSAAELLVELVGDDPGRLCSEADKLVMYADGKKTITVEDIESLIGHNRMFNAFAVIDAIIADDLAGAVKRLRNMFAASREAEYTIVGAFAFHFRRMFMAKTLIEKGLSTKQVAGQLRIWGNKDAFFRQLTKVSLERIGSVLGELARIDYSIKTGRTRAKVAMEQLVLRLGATL